MEHSTTSNYIEDFDVDGGECMSNIVIVNLLYSLFVKVDMIISNYMYLSKLIEMKIIVQKNN